VARQALDEPRELAAGTVILRRGQARFTHHVLLLGYQTLERGKQSLYKWLVLPELAQAGDRLCETRARLAGCLRSFRAELELDSGHRCGSAGGVYGVDRLVGILRHAPCVTSDALAYGIEEVLIEVSHVGIPAQHTGQCVVHDVIDQFVWIIGSSAWHLPTEISGSLRGIASRAL
jgi:hypothetical protein